MKKLGVLYLLILILLGTLILNLFVILVEAQLSESGLDPELEGDVEKIQNLTDKGQEIIEKTKEEEGREYLKKEWKEWFLNNKYLGPVINVADKILTSLNPLFTYILGTEYSLSWAFIIAITLWTAVIILIYRPIRDIFNLNSGLSFLMSFIVSSLAAHFGMEPSLNLLTNIFLNKWFIIIFFIFIIIAIILYSIFMKKFGEQIREAKKKDDERRREQKQKALEEITNITLKGQGYKK